MTTEIEAKRKELEETIKSFENHKEQICPSCENCLGCDFLSEATTDLYAFNLGVEMARKEFLDFLEPLDRSDIALGTIQEKVRELKQSLGEKTE